MMPVHPKNIEESTAKVAPEISAVDEASKARVGKAYNKLPLRFEENRGQVDKQVKFISRGSDSTLFLTPTEAVLTLRRSEKQQITTKDEALQPYRPIQLLYKMYQGKARVAQIWEAVWAA